MARTNIDGTAAGALRLRDGEPDRWWVRALPARRADGGVSTPHRALRSSRTSWPRRLRSAGAWLRARSRSTSAAISADVQARTSSTSSHSKNPWRLIPARGVHRCFRCPDTPVPESLTCGRSPCWHRSAAAHHPLELGVLGDQPPHGRLGAHNGPGRGLGVGLTRSRPSRRRAASRRTRRRTEDRVGLDGEGGRECRPGRAAADGGDGGGAPEEHAAVTGVVILAKLGSQGVRAVDQHEHRSGSSLRQQAFQLGPPVPVLVGYLPSSLSASQAAFSRVSRSPGSAGARSEEDP